MPTGFIAHSIALLLALAAGSAAAAEVTLVGIIGGSAAVLAVDGGEPKTVKVGQKWKGITVLSIEKDRATVSIDGRRRVLMQGQYARGAGAVSDRQQVMLAADGNGHFVTEGAINGNPVRFLVDTGATSIALP